MHYWRREAPLRHHQCRVLSRRRRLDTRGGDGGGCGVRGRGVGSADGRDVNHRDPEAAGETALTRRAEAGDARDVRALLAMGADPTSAGTCSRNTPWVSYSHAHLTLFICFFSLAPHPPATWTDGQNPCRLEISRKAHENTSGM